MAQLQRLTKKIILDGLAGLCFLGVILFGWLPGPGGIPFLIAGLWLLGHNHDWAKRWLENVRQKGTDLQTIFFPDNIWIRYIYDIIAGLLFAGAIYAIWFTDNRLFLSISAIAVCFAAGLFLTNRRRLQKLSKLLHRKHK